MKQTIILSVVVALATQVTSAMAGGCCGERASCSHDEHADHVAVAQKSGAKELAASLPVVLENYGKIQAALAADSFIGVTAEAQAISKALAGDANRTLTAALGAPVEALSKAKDLETARAAFKELSTALVRFLSQEKIHTGHLQIVYCDMAKAHWLQTDKAVKNPYYGKEMLTCGKIIGTF